MQAVRSWGFFGLAALLGAAWIVISLGDQSAYALIPALFALVAASAGVVQLSNRWGTVATAALALGCAWYLLELKMAGAGAGSACSIDSTFDCGKVNSSPWSELGGVPISLLGMGYYGAMLIAGVFAPRDERDQGTFDQLGFLLAVPAVAYSVFLAYISKQMDAFCIVCITMYLCNAVLLWAAWRGMKAHNRTATQGWGAVLGSTEARNAGVVFALVCVGQWQCYQEAVDPLAGTTTTAGVTDYSKLYKVAARPVELRDTSRCKGSNNPKYMVVEWADYGCPHCARAGKELKDLLALRNDVQVCFEYFALSGMCNPSLDDNGTGKERCDAAIAAECGNQQGKFWEMNDQLFTNQGYFEPDQLRFMGREAGLDLDAFDACMADPATVEAVAAAGTAGGAMGIQGTPAIFVRGLMDGTWLQMERGVPGAFELMEAVDAGTSIASPATP